ncbi:MAG: HAMP domain-containing histidine kinase [Bacteroidales bacterium]|nr:HAMP domain-containing histidine kinase [Bacteroidales bacterium]
MKDQIKLKYLNDHASLMNIECDRDGIIKEMNAYARKIAGDMTGKPFGNIVLDFTNTFNFEEVVKNGEQSRLLNVATQNNTPQTFYFRFFSTEDTIMALGELNHAELSDLETKLVRLNNELNNTSRQLQKTNSELKRLNELKNKFLGIAAHDLRNPIGLVISYADFLLEEAYDKLTDDERLMLERIQSSAEFMINLINDLLDVSRIESGKLELNLQAVDLVDLIKNNVELNQVLAEKKSITISFEHLEKIPPVKVDARKIEQVLNNLISNAVKFSHPGSSVKLDIFRDSKHVNVSVTDYGQGIPKEERPKLFKTFSRTSVQATGGERSTGLGLVIARNIIMGHGGDIWVESEVGKGSTFYFSIPLKK